MMYQGYGNRGMAFEMLVNMANTQYANGNVALINKRPTPVKILKTKMNQVTGVFDSKSTVDFDGVYKGKAIYFEAKSVKGKRFDLNNIHQHQLDHLEKASKHGAVCFLLIEFSELKKIYMVSHTFVRDYYEDAKIGGRKSIPLADFDKHGNEVKSSSRALLDYLIWIDRNYIDVG